MLVKQLQNAITSLETSLDDLAYSAEFIKRIKDPYTPGQSITYTETSYTLKVVIIGYDQSEIDGDRIQAQDAKIIVFNSSSVIPEPNDTITVNAIQYRVIRNQPLYAGSEIILSIVQARPLN